MKNTVEYYTCDICGAQMDRAKSVNYPVLFYTNQTDGSPTDPYISQERLDVCEECLNKIVKVHGTGAQGNNNYTISK